MQIGRAGARQAGDDDGRVDLLVQDRRIARFLFLEAREITQEAVDVPARCQPAEGREGSLLLERVPQHAERLRDVVAADAGRAGAFRQGFQESLEIRFPSDGIGELGAKLDDGQQPDARSHERQQIWTSMR